MEKVLVKIYVPTLEEIYDLWIPIHETIYNIINLIDEAISEITKGDYEPERMPLLYDKATAECFDVNLTVQETTIRNGAELIMI